MKFYLKKSGFGTSWYYIIKTASEDKARKLKNIGIKVFDTRSEAQEYIRSKK